MNAVGIICEYNPLHDGHCFHISEAKKRSGCDTVICVMSGAFVQRGSPAVQSPFVRAGWALKAGADCVLLLPTVYSLSPADIFASAGIRFLDATGIVSAFSYGISVPDHELHERIASVLLAEPESFSSALKTSMKNGLGYPAAVSQALASQFETTDDISLVTQSANDMLAVRYLMQNSCLAHPMLPVPVNRLYGISASSVREVLSSDLPVSSLPLPSYVRNSLSDMKSFDYDAMLAGQMRKIDETLLSSLPDTFPGLISQIMKHSSSENSAEKIIAKSCGKNVTRSRVRRILWYAFLGITASFQQQAKETLPYLRVLGIREDRKDILSALQEHSSIPVCVSASDLPDDPFAQKCAALDALAFDIQALSLQPGTAGSWFRSPLVTVT